MSIGQRLKQVRKARHLNQEAFGSMGGVSRKMQSLFESDDSLPNAAYFISLQRSGLDAGYLLTGSSALTDPLENELLRRFRGASEEMQAAALRLLESSAVPAGGGVKIAGGRQGQVVSARRVRQNRTRIDMGQEKKPPKP